MIGTTSVMESEEEIMYPSISVCSVRRGDKHHNASHTSQRSFNLSHVMASVEVYQRNNIGLIEKKTISPIVEDFEDRYIRIVILLLKSS